MDYQDLEKIAEELTVQLADDLHSMIADMAAQLVDAYIEGEGIEMEIDDVVIIENIIENNWTYHV